MKPSPLSAPDLEAAVLGAVLQDPLELEKLKPVLTPEDFAEPRHTHVFAAMLAVADRRVSVDHLTVSEELKARGLLAPVGGPAYLMSLDQGVPLASRSVEYAQTVRDLALRRRAVSAASQMGLNASTLSMPVEQVLTDGARAWAGLTHAVRGVRKGSEHLLDLLDDLDKAQKGESEPAIPTGIDLWDAAFGGLQPGKLSFIGSLPGVGKSSLMAAMVENLCCSGRRVGFFSLEDLGRWLPRRILAKRAQVPLFVLAMRPLTPPQMQRVAEASQSVHGDLAGLVIDERSMLTPAQIVQTARDMVVNQDVDVIFLDHLGKVDFESSQHHAHDLAIEHGLNQLTAFAKDYDVPLVIAAHLKEREKDALYQRPDLTSFARTAFIERDARVAVGLYLEKGDADVLNVAVLKQTEGESGQDFQLRRLKECGMVASRNGRPRTDNYEQAEARMLREGTA